jgi:putative endonuclease
MNNTPQPDKRTKKRKLGDIGENCACTFLEKHGYRILERNYLRKWGEIDIVAQKGERIHFVEVKSVKVSNLGNLGVSHENSGLNGSRETYRPEENLHPGKLKRLYRTIETYLLHKKLDADWQLDLITAKIDLKTRQARVEILENIVG